MTLFKIINKKTKNDLGIIRFSDMIPVPQESVYPLDNIVTKDKKSKVSKFYKDLSCNFKLLGEKCIKYQN